MFERILIAYDGSLQAHKALEKGLQLAKELQSKVTVATIHEPLNGFYEISALVAPSLPEDLREEEGRRLEKLQLSATLIAATYDVVIKTVLLESEEVAGILRVAEEEGATLLVIGLRKHATGIEWAGTVRRVANESPCSILAVV